MNKDIKAVLENLRNCPCVDLDRLVEEIGWDNLPDGWDEDSLDKFARSLTGKDKEDTEGFFTECVEHIQDEEDFDEESAKKFCAALKDEYLGTTDWRGKGEHEQGG